MTGSSATRANRRRGVSLLGIAGILLACVLALLSILPQPEWPTFAVASAVGLACLIVIAVHIRRRGPPVWLAAIARAAQRPVGMLCVIAGALVCGGFGTAIVLNKEIPSRPSGSQAQVDATRAEVTGQVKATIAVTTGNSGQERLDRVAVWLAPDRALQRYHLDCSQHFPVEHGRVELRTVPLDIRDGLSKWGSLAWFGPWTLHVKCFGKGVEAANRRQRFDIPFVEEFDSAVACKLDVRSDDAWSLDGTGVARNRGASSPEVLTSRWRFIPRAMWRVRGRACATDPAYLGWGRPQDHAGLEVAFGLMVSVVIRDHARDLHSVKLGMDRYRPRSHRSIRTPISIASGEWFDFAVCVTCGSKDVHVLLRVNNKIAISEHVPTQALRTPWSLRLRAYRGQIQLDRIEVDSPVQGTCSSARRGA